MSLGLRLRTLRKNASLTQQKLADNVGVSRIYIQALESNRRVPSIKLLYRLADALAATVNDIVDEYPGHGGRLQLEELLSSGEVDVWFRKKKLSEGDLRRVERVIDAVLAEWDEEDDGIIKIRPGRKARGAKISVL
ncbi:MAG: helix-turn-helix domain-containing protein [Synergistaceae bacterium]|jgi:transcriptional regulator with XRE-family HTH domain|nr:helix-turn-helix domain-containing protein [Synergistaceae bacterium]